MWVPCSPLKWSIIAKNRMLSVPSVQVGPALPLVAAATASRSKPSSLHCTERPRMKTASAIRGRHEVSDTALHSSSQSHPSTRITIITYHLTLPTYVMLYLARILIICVFTLWINIFQFQFQHSSLQILIRIIKIMQIQDWIRIGSTNCMRRSKGNLCCELCTGT